MTKILCLGNNTEDTDVRTRKLAANSKFECHGLLSELVGPLVFDKPGYYHSSVYDIEYGQLLTVASNFTQVIILDQPKELYSHPDAFYKTIRLAQQLPHAIFIDPSYATNINFFENLVATNKSFCIFPFVELLTNNNNTTVCCRSFTPITELSKLKSFKTDPNYTTIRNKMIAGELVPEHCGSCYKLEEQNIISARIQETVEWANRLNLTSIKDLTNIEYPAYYEVRPSNICNLQCRTCDPISSHLIGHEYKKLNLITDLPQQQYTNFDFVNFTNLKKLYVAGGEPTAMPEFYDFVDKCIQIKRTDFEFLINTNGTKINPRFKEQIKHFSNMQFIFSIDGLGELNHYIRWPSRWESIVDNINYLRSNQIVVSTNTTVSIYNISTLYELLKFFDTNLPGMLVHCQFAESKNNLFSALNFPNTDLVLTNLIKCQSLNCYKNDPLLASFIDGIIAHYQKKYLVDLKQLTAFFEFNDKLDNARNIKLSNYIPELEQCRTLIT